MVDVAVLNTSEEVAELLEMVLQGEGWSTARGYVVDFKDGRRDFAEFLIQHDPRVIVWDIAIPYEENWSYYQQVHQLPIVRGRTFILTTTNVARLEELVGDVPAMEIVGRPFDMAVLIANVRDGLGSRADREEEET